MSRFQYKKLAVEDHFDKDGELEVTIKGRCSVSWLPREEVVCLRDHLNKVLGVAE